MSLFRKLFGKKDATPPNWFCPHSPIPVDCMICGKLNPNKTTEEREQDRRENERHRRREARLETEARRTTARVQPNVWYCPHSPIPTNCRICHPEDMPQQDGVNEEAVRSAVAMGFTLAQAHGAMLRLVARNAPVTTESLIDGILNSDSSSSAAAVAAGDPPKPRQRLQLRQRPPPSTSAPPQPVVQPSAPSQQQLLAAQAPPSASALPAPAPSQSAPAAGGRELCVVCFASDVDAVLAPCGHLCLCNTCANSIKSSANNVCPICRRPIENVIRVFRS